MERVFPVAVLGLMAVAFLSACVECAEQHSLRESGLLFYAHFDSFTASERTRAVASARRPIAFIDSALAVW